MNNLSPAEKNEVKPLVDSENRDRRALYLEVAKSMNVSPDQLIKVQGVFAEKWQQSASSGWWIQKGEAPGHRKNPSQLKKRALPESGENLSGQANFRRAKGFPPDSI